MIEHDLQSSNLYYVFKDGPVGMHDRDDVHTSVVQGVSQSTKLSINSPETFDCTASKVYINRKEDLRVCNEQQICFKLILIVSGNGVVAINGHKLHISPLSIMALNDKDSVELYQSNDIIAHSVYFSPVVINRILTISNIYNVKHELFDDVTKSDLSILKFFLADAIQKKVFQVTEIIAMQISLLMDKMENEITSQDTDYRLFSIRLYTSQLLLLLTKVALKDPMPIMEIPDAPKDIEKIILYLHTHFHTQITLNSLAHEFRTNRTTISNNFKKSLKMTIMVYLTKVRIQAAAYLLRNTNLSIYEVASKTGFVDLPHFSRTFKKHWKYTPGDFRQSFNQELPEKESAKAKRQLTYSEYIQIQV